MRLFSLVTILLLIPLPALADGHLVVLISIDQLRQDYLNRFEADLTAGGFDLFQTRGAVFTDANFDYASTVTGPGHATISTGAYGKTHGIVGNSWYDRQRGRNVYCVGDSTTTLVGAPGPGASPRLLIGSTIGDELRIGSGFHSKVFSISSKDRAAILLGGALANGAFWFIDSSIVTSTYYMRELPEWVKRFNAGGQINAFHGAVWDRALPAGRYGSSTRTTPRMKTGATAWAGRPPQNRRRNAQGRSPPPTTGHFAPPPCQYAHNRAGQ